MAVKGVVGVEMLEDEVDDRSELFPEPEDIVND